jgi:hypothetical protein
MIISYWMYMTCWMIYLPNMLLDFPLRFGASAWGVPGFWLLVNAPVPRSARAAALPAYAARRGLDRVTATVRTQRAGIWAGVASIVLFAVGWVALMQFIPPLAPSRSAHSIAGYFAAHRTGIRLGSVLMIASAVLWIPWAAAIAAPLRWLERDHPVLVPTQVASAALAAAVIIVGLLCWVVAAFRPGRSVSQIQLLSDMGFILTIMPFAIFVVWNVALGLAIFADDRATPAYPRWAGYFCMWMAFLYIPGGALAFFHTGPLAWNGLLAFFVPAIAFFIWIIVMTVLALQRLQLPDVKVAGDRRPVPAAPAAVSVD